MFSDDYAVTIKDKLHATTSYTRLHVDNKVRDVSMATDMKNTEKSDFTEYLSHDIIAEICLNYFSLKTIITLQKVNKKFQKGKLFIDFLTEISLSFPT